MQDEETITEGTLPETEVQATPQAEPMNVPAPGSEPAVSDVEGLTLEELNSHLGKQFPTKEAALKSIKDTYSYVGRKAPVQPDPNQFVSKAEFEEATFYASNPEYKAHAELIGALAAKTGKPVSEVVQMDSFKTVFDKVKTADEFEASKSVLQSNPRLGQVTDKMTQAREALKSGNPAAANSAAVSAVLGAYES